jgi:hypothetical protein
MTRRTTTFAGAAAMALALGLATPAWAQSTHVEQDPAVKGNLNKCWGQIASQTAKLGTPEGTSGGGMGQHSRATKAADINGGFAATGNGFGITFNVNGGRQGVGNVSADANGFHQTHPGDGGNGQHAMNNAGLATVLNPVTGQSTPLNTNNPGDAEIVQLECVP